MSTTKMPYGAKVAMNSLAEIIIELTADRDHWQRRATDAEAHIAQEQEQEPGP
jgi:hypothetical protein